MEMNDAVGKVGDMQKIPGQAFINYFLRIRIYRFGWGKSYQDQPSSSWRGLEL